jgi:alkyl hydroperoxide reductase subunit AhpC
MKLLHTFWTAAVLVLSSAVDAVEVGDAIPDGVSLHFGFPPEMISVKDRVAGKKVILVGLPGAFTPTCSTRQVVSSIFSWMGI